MTLSKEGRAAQITFRCSGTMLRAVDELVAIRGEGETRNTLLELLVNQFLLDPRFFNPIDVRLLREPVTEIVVLNVSVSIKSKLEQLAVDRGVSVSVLMRNIIYVGTLKEGSREREEV